MFADGRGIPAGDPDHLSFDLSEHGSISLGFLAKAPVPGMAVQPARLRYSFADAPGHAQSLEAYERLIHDALTCDHTLFTSSAGIERRLWEISAAVLATPPLLRSYPPGSWDPPRPRISPLRAPGISAVQAPHVPTADRARPGTQRPQVPAAGRQGLWGRIRRAEGLWSPRVSASTVRSTGRRVTGVNRSKIWRRNLGGMISIVDPVLHALTGHFLAQSAIGALIVFSAASVSKALEALLGVIGIGITTLLFAVLGNLSAGGPYQGLLLPILADDRRCATQRCGHHRDTERRLLQQPGDQRAAAHHRWLVRARHPHHHRSYRMLAWTDRNLVPLRLRSNEAEPAGPAGGCHGCLAYPEQSRIDNPKPLLRDKRSVTRGCDARSYTRLPVMPDALPATGAPLLYELIVPAQPNSSFAALDTQLTTTRIWTRNTRSPTATTPTSNRHRGKSKRSTVGGSAPSWPAHGTAPEALPLLHMAGRDESSAAGERTS